MKIKLYKNDAEIAQWPKMPTKGEIIEVLYLHAMPGYKPVSFNDPRVGLLVNFVPQQIASAKFYLKQVDSDYSVELKKHHWQLMVNGVPYWSWITPPTKLQLMDAINDTLPKSAWMYPANEDLDTLLNAANMTIHYAGKYYELVQIGADFMSSVPLTTAADDAEKLAKLLNFGALEDGPKDVQCWMLISIDTRVRILAWWVIQPTTHQLMKVLPTVQTYTELHQLQSDGVLQTADQSVTYILREVEQGVPIPYAEIEQYLPKLSD